MIEQMKSNYGEVSMQGKNQEVNPNDLKQKLPYCSTCQKSFARKSCLRRHVLLEHENHRPNEDKTNPKQFMDQLLDALYDDDVRRNLSSILLDPLLDRVRELELKQSKTEKLFTIKLLTKFT